jgi:regulatory protein
MLTCFPVSVRPATVFMIKTITALKEQKNHHARVNVFLDGEFAFGVSKTIGIHLHIGQVVSENEILELQKKDRFEYGYQKIQPYLSFRPRSVAETTRKLEILGIETSIADKILERAKQERLLDDTQFSQLWVENRIAFHPRGKKLLGYELRKKGIEDELIQSAILGIDEEKMASQAAEKYLKHLEKLDWKQFQIKLGGYLQRRGFTYSVIREISQQLWKKIKVHDINE